MFFRRLAAAFIALCLGTAPAIAASTTAWIAGNGAGSTWTAAFASADLASITTGKSVLSSDTIDNTSALDQWGFLSIQLTGSADPTAGDAAYVYIEPLQQDGSTYGDGLLTAGTQTTFVPTLQPVCVVTMNAASTAINWPCGPFIIPPLKFKFALYWNTASISLTSGTQTIKYSTYNVNLNR